MGSFLNSFALIIFLVSMGFVRFFDGTYICPGFSPRASSCSFVSWAFFI